jgi:hypothetical protein
MAPWRWQAGRLGIETRRTRSRDKVELRCDAPVSKWQVRRRSRDVRSCRRVLGAGRTHYSLVRVHVIRALMS